MIAFASVLALNGVVFSSISAHVVPLFEGLGFTAASAVTLAALIGPAQVASRIGDILAGHHVKTMTLGLIAVGLLPAALIIFAGEQRGKAKLEALTSAHALTLLGRHAFNLHVLQREGLDMLATIARDAAAFRLRGADLGRRAALVTQALTDS